MRHFQTWFLVFFTVALVGFGPGGYWSATWLAKWAFLIGSAGAGFCLWVACETSLWYLPLLAYVMGSLFYLAAWPGSPYAGEIDAVTLLALQKNAFAGLAEFVTVTGLIALLCRKPAWVRKAPHALAAVWVLGVTGMLLQRAPADDGLWFGNPSMGASLVACCLPFVWSCYPQKKPIFRLWTLAATWLAIYRTGASVPWGVMGTVIVAYSMAQKPTWRRVFVAAPVLLAGLLLTGRALLGPVFWQDTGRFEIWSMAWRWFRDHGRLSVGMGFSSSQILLPLEQVITQHYNGSYFLWLHNDWLQILIEGGVLGALCAALATGRMLWATWKHPALFAGLAGFMATAVFNYPLRMPTQCLCLALICAMAEITRWGEKLSRLRSESAQRAGLMPA